ncbi:hypothetical protein [Azohydromonas aeria]|uniref:hypothetical protein n=1 Tax=Azohydromonas aeria TaxID=2590212 RepID=UPI0012F97442|nr:hypothetical protein [Azohydromonas aeria]
MVSLETIKTPTTEVFVQGREGFAVVTTNWSNHEGVNVIATGKDCAVRFAASLRHEEVDALMLALQAARAA